MPMVGMPTPIPFILTSPFLSACVRAAPTAFFLTTLTGHRSTWVRSRPTIIPSEPKGRTELLFFPRSLAEKSFEPIHGVGGPNAPAGAMGHRVPSVPLQLLSREHGPIYRRQFSPAGYSMRCHFPGHPLYGWVSSLHMGQKPLSQSKANDLG